MNSEYPPPLPPINRTVKEQVQYIKKYLHSRCTGVNRWTPGQAPSTQMSDFINLQSAEASRAEFNPVLGAMLCALLNVRERQSATSRKELRLGRQINRALRQRCPFRQRRRTCFPFLSFLLLLFVLQSFYSSSGKGGFLFLLYPLKKILLYTSFLF